MIGNDEGRKNNVVVQWVSYDYLVRNKRDLKTVTIEPDEYCVVIHGGRIDSVVTQAKINAVPGFFSRLRERLAGTNDLQLVIVDSRKHTLTLPFEAYSSDKDIIRGTVNLMVQIRGADCINAIRLLKEHSPIGSLNCQRGYSEYCLEDIAELLRNNMQYIIDTDSISLITSEEIYQKRPEICADLKASLNAKSPYWSNYGLTVNYSAISIDENSYEKTRRDLRETKINSLQRDVDYSEAQGASEHAIRMHELINREKAAIELDDYLSALNVDVTKKAREAEAEHTANLSQIDNEADVQRRVMERRHQLEMQALYNDIEKRRVHDSSDLSDAEKDVQLKQIELRKDQIQVSLNDILRQESRKDVDDSLYPEREKFKLESEKKQKSQDLELDLQMKKLELEFKEKEAALQRQLDLEREKHRMEMEKANSDNDFLLRSMQETHSAEGHRIDAERDVKLRETEASETIAKYQTDADKARLQALYDESQKRLDDAKAQAVDEHNRAMDLMDKMIQNTSVSRGGGYAAPSVSLECPKCGAKLGKDSKFCPGCGYRLGVTDPSE